MSCPSKPNALVDAPIRLRLFLQSSCKPEELIKVLNPNGYNAECIPQIKVLSSCTIQQVEAAKLCTIGHHKVYRNLCTIQSITNLLIVEP